MSDEEYAALVTDIRANGLHTPIVVNPAGVLLDGRHRLRACEEIGIECPRRVVEAQSETAWIVSENLHRRHLDTSQRAMLALAFLPMLEDEAAARRAATLKQNQEEPDSANLREREEPEPADPDDGKASEHAAALLGVSPRSVESAKVVSEHGVPELAAAVLAGSASVSAAAEVARLPADEQRSALGEPDGVTKAAKAAKAAKSRAVRVERINRRAKEASAGERPLALDEVGGRRYPVLLADPPWRYESGTADPKDSIENHYPTMPLDEIKALPVRDVAADDAVLFLWATSPKLTEALDVMVAWGFTYRTCMVWVKDRIGLGYYARQRHELLLIGVRGSLPVPPPQARPDSVISAPRHKHSEKPPIVRELIETMYPEFGRLELFCRNPKAGWAAWGNECAR